MTMREFFSTYGEIVEKEETIETMLETNFFTKFIGLQLDDACDCQTVGYNTISFYTDPESEGDIRFFEPGWTLYTDIDAQTTLLFKEGELVAKTIQHMMGPHMSQEGQLIGSDGQVIKLYFRDWPYGTSEWIEESLDSSRGAYRKREVNRV